MRKNIFAETYGLSALVGLWVGSMDQSQARALINYVRILQEERTALRIALDSAKNTDYQESEALCREMYNVRLLLHISAEHIKLHAKGKQGSRALLARIATKLQGFVPDEECWP